MRYAFNIILDLVGGNRRSDMELIENHLKEMMSKEITKLHAIVKLDHASMSMFTDIPSIDLMEEIREMRGKN